MSVYTETQVRESFWTYYYDQYKTYTGVEDAYDWWKNPLQKCMQQDAGRGRGRCAKVCDHCRKHGR